MYSSNLQPDKWLIRHAALIPQGEVLDLACGAGRHGRYCLDKDYRVTFIDRDITCLRDLKDNPQANLLEYDLEASPWPFQPRQFSGIVVSNYLHRPLFPAIIDALTSGGVLLYQTFAVGNEQYGKPSSPDFLLGENELRDVFSKTLQVIDFQQGYRPNPDRVTQGICAVKP